MEKPQGRRIAIPLLLCLAFAAALGVLAVSWGQAANWDLRNYHLYGAWAWLNGRAGYDLAPAQVQSFFNPLLHVPLYWLLTGIRPEFSTFLLGALQALNVVPIYLIARRLSGADAPRWLLLLAAVAGATGATQLGELGASQGDNLVSIPFLAGLALLFAAHDAGIAPRRALALRVAAGVLFGAATGLKLTLAPIAFGVVLALPLLGSNRREALALVAAVLCGAVAGGLATAGPWMWEMWQNYGNPMHPMLADLFPSRWSLPFVPRDMRFVPDTAAEILAYPYLWLADPHLVSELRFRDLRIPLLYTLLPVLALCGPCRRRLALNRPLMFLLLAFATGYAAWLALFGYYRYLSVWEMLAPAMVLAVLGQLVSQSRRGRAAAAVILVVLVLGTNPPEWGRVQPQGTRFLQVELPREFEYGNALVTLAGNNPTAYLALGFPPATRFVRISGNISGPHLPVHELDHEAARLLDAHAGPLYLLLQEENVAVADPALARFALRTEASGCRVVRSNLAGPHETPARICPLVRTGQANAALAAIEAGGS